jgi:hypothetical protein
MLIYAGIDEAGYGPLFGPLVVTRSVFALDNADPLLPPPPLWRLLNSVICRRPGDSRGRIAVNDSKILYSPLGGVAHLERAVLGFISQLAMHPTCLPELLDCLAFDELSRRFDHPCYLLAGVGPLPLQVEPRDLQIVRARLGRAALRTGVRLTELSVAVALEDRFNRLLDGCGNKALGAWTFVAGHLQAIWDRYGCQQPQVVIDRQGGRIYYRELLAALFPRAGLCIHRESTMTSEYEIREGERCMRIIVQVNSERFHLPAAFASMTAKYIRELLMLCFQSFWHQHAPKVRPTCGYYRDGRRFLQEVEPLFTALGLERETLVRRR